jgi:hypothetical protein
MLSICCHNFDKFVQIDRARPALIGLPNHLTNLLIGDLLADLVRYSPQVGRAYRALGSKVKEAKGLLDGRPSWALYELAEKDLEIPAGLRREVA